MSDAGNTRNAENAGDSERDDLAEYRARIRQIMEEDRDLFDALDE